MRKLAISAFSFSAAIFLSCYLLPVRWLAACGLTCTLAGLLLAVFRRRWLKGFVLAFLSLAAGFLWFGIHDLWTVKPADAMDGQLRTLDVRLLDYPVSYLDYDRATVRLEGQGVPHLTAILYDNAGSLRGARPGSHLHLTAKVKAADIRNGERYGSYHSRDQYLILSCSGQIRVTEPGFDLRSLPVMLNHRISELIEICFPSDTRAFMKSLLLGEKAELYEDAEQQQAISRAGLMHTLAVSGMHVAFLVGLIQLLFGNSRQSALGCVGLVWLFVLVTGATPSAVRAGVMQSFLLFAPVVNRENDPVTSLSAALGLILLQNPFAAASVSLQLSFASMAGIMLWGGKLRRLLHIRCPYKHLSNVLDWVSATTASSLAVLPLTLPLMAIHFGYVSLLSPVSNVLCLWAVSLCFCGGYLTLLIALLLPGVGTALGLVLAWPVRWILLVARGIAGLPFSVLTFRQ